jgi:hypothetical protein
MSGSKAEFCSAIQQQLQNDGVLDDITASIRSRIILLLRNEFGPTASAPRKDTNSQRTALLSLLYNFLEQNQFTHTLSVFAAESKMERSLPLTLTDAIKELGLQAIWKKFNKTDKFHETDILSLLQGVAHSHMVSMQQEKMIETEIKVIDNSYRVQASKAIQTEIESFSRPLTSKSIQTDVKSLPHTFSDSAQKVENNDDNRGGYCNQSSILSIERECQQRMRQEMNEKLRLSAKTQAIQASRRLEQKHKEALLLLHDQIEAERRQSQRRQHELTEKLTQQHMLAQHEQSKITLRLEATLLEKSSLQSEMDLLNERVKEMQKQRFKEWTDEQEMLQRKALDSMNELDGEKRNLQTQLHEVDMQKEAMRAKETQLAWLTQEKSALLAEIADLRHHQTAFLESQECTQFNFQTQLAAVQEKYFAAKADLHTSRDEVAGLLALLKQSQKAIESISFREIGAVNVCSPPAINSRSAMRPASQPVSQLGSRAHLKAGAKIVSFAHPSLTASCESATAASLPPPAMWSDSKNHPQNHDRASMTTNPLKNDSAPQQILSNGTRAIDPPCCSSEDPPETQLQWDGIWGKSRHKKVVGNHEEHADVNNSIDTFVGKEIVLDLSLITEHVQQEELIASMSMPSMVQVALPAEATYSVTTLPEQSNFGGREISVVKEDFTENIASGVLWTKLLPPNKPYEKVKEEDEPEKYEVAPEHCDHKAHQSLCSSNEKTGPLLANNAQHSIVGTEQYSEHFQSFDEEICQPPIFQASSEQPTRYEDDVTRKNNKTGSPGSAMSRGYSESFCS